MSDKCRCGGGCAICEQEDRCPDLYTGTFFAGCLDIEVVDGLIRAVRVASPVDKPSVNLAVEPAGPSAALLEQARVAGVLLGREQACDELLATIDAEVRAHQNQARDLAAEADYEVAAVNSSWAECLIWLHRYLKQKWKDRR